MMRKLFLDDVKIFGKVRPFSQSAASLVGLAGRACPRPPAFPSRGLHGDSFVLPPKNNRKVSIYSNAFQ